jgi:glucosylceramidase
MEVLCCRFLDAYAGHNISFWGLTIQNEPLLGALPDFPWQTMYWNVTMQRDFIANTLGPILRRSIYGQRIALMTMDDQRSLLPDWADIVSISPISASDLQSSTLFLEKVSIKKGPRGLF